MERKSPRQKMKLTYYSSPPTLPELVGPLKEEECRRGRDIPNQPTLSSQRRRRVPRDTTRGKKFPAWFTLGGTRTPPATTKAIHLNFSRKKLPSPLRSGRWVLCFFFFGGVFRLIYFKGCVFCFGGVVGVGVTTPPSYSTSRVLDSRLLNP